MVSTIDLVHCSMPMFSPSSSNVNLYSNAIGNFIWQHVSVWHIQLLISFLNISSDVVQLGLKPGNETLWQFFSETLGRIISEKNL